MLDAEVAELVGPVRHMLPSRGFIREHVLWAIRQTDAPAIFHLGVALTQLSTMVNSRAVVGFGAGAQELNLYTMVVGGSGSSRKSTAVKFAEKNIHQIDGGSRIGPSLGSYEGMVNSLAERPTQLVIEPEFSRLLSQSQNRTGGFLAALKTGLTQAYDSDPLSRKTMKVDTGQITGYRISLLGAISGSYLSLYTEPEDWTGGFMSRWLLMFGDRERFLVMGDPSPAAVAAGRRVRDKLEHIYYKSPAGRLEICPDTETFRMYECWARGLDKCARETEKKLQGVYERASALTRRIAALYAIDRLMEEGVECLPDPLADAERRWQIEPIDLYFAHLVVASHLQSAEKIVATVAHSRDAREKAEVLGSIPPVGVTLNGIARGGICRVTGLLKQRVITILDTLKEEGQVAEKLVGTGVCYEKIETPRVVLQQTPGQSASVLETPPAPPTAAAHLVTRQAQEYVEPDYDPFLPGPSADERE